MKTKDECVVLVNAAIGAILEECDAKTRQEVGNLMTLLVSTCALGLSGALGIETAKAIVQRAHDSLGNEQNEQARILLTPGAMQ